MKPGKKLPKKERVLAGEEKVPQFQLRSMAQTRACAKAFRNVLSWVIVLAGYKATPAEELPDAEHTANTPEPEKPTVQQPQRKSTAAPANVPPEGIYESPSCPNCQSPMNLKPAGTKKDGKPYPAFWSCSTRTPSGRNSCKPEITPKGTIRIR